MATADEPDHRLARSLKKEELLSSLRWHNAHALGALTPPTAFNFRLPSPPSFDLNPFRSHVWWKGLPTPRDEFTASPLIYEILSVESVQPLSEEKALVTFRAKASSLSPFFLTTESLSLENLPGPPRPTRDAAEKLIGLLSDLEVTFQESEYGYYLPLVRFPDDKLERR